VHRDERFPPPVYGALGDMLRRRALFPLAVAVAAVQLALAGCSTGADQGAPTTPPASGATSDEFRFATVSVQGPFGSEPAVLIGDEPQTMNSFVVQDVIRGTGRVATEASTVTVQYVGRSARTKQTFDSSWLRGKAYTLVPSKVPFSAFHDGVPGMRVGGRRLVIIPAALGFGANPPQGSGLSANDNLVFVIDLVSVA